jgi:hypothetical protein
VRRLRRLRAGVPGRGDLSEDDVPGQRAQFSTENARFSGQLGSPGGTS